MAWANDAEAAGTNANLWLGYVAVLLLLVVLLGCGGRARTLLLFAGIGIAVVAAYVLVRLVDGHMAALFDSGRLNLPLGYVNGEGCVFAMAIWLAVALAESKRAVVAAPGAAAGVVFAGLTLMSESRGAAVATFVTLIAALALVPGFRRRAIALLFIAAGLTVAAHPLLHIYNVGTEQSVPASVARHGALTLLIAAVVVGLVWGVVVGLGGRLLQGRGSVSRSARACDDDRRRAGGRCANRCRGRTSRPAGALGQQTVALVRRRVQLRHCQQRAGQAAVRLGRPLRLLAGGLAGLQAASHRWGSAPATTRRTITCIAGRRSRSRIPTRWSFKRYPSSGSLGSVFWSCSSLASASVGGGCGPRRATPTRRAQRWWRLGGTTLAWFVDTSGDWMHLIPGVTAIALCGVAVLCDPSLQLERSRQRAVSARLVTNRRLVPFAGAVAIVVVLAIAGGSLLRAGVAQIYLDKAISTLARDPNKAITYSQRVLSIDDANLNAYYVKAAGEARFDLAGQARKTLLRAAGQDPTSLVTWTLLGDLETRAGHSSAARTYYRRAHELDR